MERDCFVVEDDAAFQVRVGSLLVRNFQWHEDTVSFDAKARNDVSDYSLTVGGLPVNGSGKPVVMPENEKLTTVETHGESVTGVLPGGEHRLSIRKRPFPDAASH